MQVSVIIISYNTRYFLEQCLSSVVRAIEKLSVVTGDHNQVEVFVVDNNSSDKTLEYLTPAFGAVRFIQNQENTGFAKANNQVLPDVSGKYILFLNPDTILPEDFFIKCLSFLDKNVNAGAVGVQMINGHGHFLNESKRGFPSPWASFTKLFGLAGLFPSSRIFAKYYMGHLDQNLSHQVEALSGACMMVRKEVLDKTGGFDERFFMYAEDLDLSFRIHQQGYKNYYLADTTIIHFKGQSTIKDRRYVKLFYQAMIQFVEKHYSDRSRLYPLLLKSAIWLRRQVELGKREIKKTGMKEASLRLSAKGDINSISEVRALPLPHVTIVDPGEKADGIVLCEGNEMPFTMLIEAMKGAPGQNYQVHALGSAGMSGDLYPIKIGMIDTTMGHR